MQHAVAHQNESSVIRHLAPLVKIESERVRALDSLEPRRQIRSQNRQRATRTVDVKPKPLATAQAGQGVQVINGSGADSSGGSYHQKRRQARASISFDRFFKRI